MEKTCSMLKKEEGSILAIALMILVFLTLIGIAVTRTAQIEVRVAHNERVYERVFYVADSGWNEGALWLDDPTRAAAPPPTVNTDLSDQTVRNFGDGGTDVTNDDFPSGTEDGSLDGIPYWYRVTYVGSEHLPGSGKEYRGFTYRVTSNADGTQEVEVRVSKIYKVGY